VIIVHYRKFNSSTNRLSVSNDSGAFISSRFIPQSWRYGFAVSTKRIDVLYPFLPSKTSISARFLNNNAFPSITGLNASGPISDPKETAQN
jgi:pyoverdine/dityrosine biosynthesis protein Dit1